MLTFSTRHFLFDHFQELLQIFSINPNVLPEIHSSSEIFGQICDGSALENISICGVSKKRKTPSNKMASVKSDNVFLWHSQIIGNQQSSLIGEMCFEKGQTKVSYRNACFLMCNTGGEKVISERGLVTTIAYKMGKNQPAVYALEGSVAVGGTALHWMGNKLGIMKPHETSEMLASSVYSTGDVYVVPAINSLYAPSWKSDAKG